VSSTLKRVSSQNTVLETIPRENLWEAQTPQVFRRQLLLDAYAQRGGQVSSTLNIVSIDLLSESLVISRNSYCPAMLYNRAWLQRGSPDGWRMLNEPSEAIGIYPRTKPVITELPLESGTLVLMFTDGVWSAGQRAHQRISIASVVTPCLEQDSLRAEDIADLLSIKSLIDYSLSDMPDKSNRDKSYYIIKSLFKVLNKEISKSNFYAALMCGITTLLAGAIPLALYTYLPTPLDIIVSLGFVGIIVVVFLVRYRSKKSNTPLKLVLFETVGLIAIATLISLLIGGGI